MPSQIVYFSTGQAGIQMSNAVWELYCIEHGISVDGKLLDRIGTNNEDRVEVFFYETDNGCFVPRSIISDLEATVVDEIRTGAYKSLYHPECIINGYEDAANNYARGYCTQGKTIINKVLRQVRKQTERCDSLQGLYFTTGLGGGTGSGFNSLILKEIADLLGKKSKVTLNIFPGPSMSTAVVEPINVVLVSNSCIELTDVSITLDNQATYNVCKQSLKFASPTYTHVNRIMAYVNSSITASLRFHSVLNSDLAQLQTNLVPYPRIHFPVVSYAPLVTADSAERERITAAYALKEAFSSSGRLISCDTCQGRFMACNILFRGEVSPREINEAVTTVKTKHNIEFVDWCPTGIKIGLVPMPMCNVPNSFLATTKLSVTKLSNSTALVAVFQRLMRKFNALFQKRAFVHWYIGEGMEEGEITDARDVVEGLIRDYIEAGRKEGELPPPDNDAEITPPPAEEGDEEDKQFQDINEEDEDEDEMEPEEDKIAGEDQPTGEENNTGEGQEEGPPEDEEEEEAAAEPQEEEEETV